jgi:hypothetical protein
MMYWFAVVLTHYNEDIIVYFGIVKSENCKEVVFLDTLIISRKYSAVRPTELCNCISPDYLYAVKPHLLHKPVTSKINSHFVFGV